MMERLLAQDIIEGIFTIFNLLYIYSIICINQF